MVIVKKFQIELNRNRNFIGIKKIYYVLQFININKYFIISKISFVLYLDII